MIKNGIFEHVNPKLEKLTGYVNGTLTGKDSRLLYIDDEEYKRVTSEKYHQLNRFGNSTIESTWLCKNGRMIDVLLGCSPIVPNTFDAGFTLTVLDITERKEALRNLSRAFNELDQIFNAAVPICLIAEECVITRVNEAFCECFAVDAEEVTKSSGVDFWDCCAMGTTNCPMTLLKDTGRNSFQRMTEKTINGEARQFSDNSVPHYDEDSRFIGIISTFLDLTDFNKKQKELRQTQLQLQHMEKLSAIGRFSASIAHEFNNPLCGVTTVLQGIREHVSMEKSDRQLTDLALQECERMASLIRKILKFNSPSSGRWEQIDIHRTIDEILLFVKQNLRERNILVHKKYDLDIPPIWAIEDQIKQVLLNVIGNAADALTVNGGGKIIVSTAHGGKTIQISVSDNGVGITADNMQYIFEPFFSTKKAKGSGLGLPVSFGIIKSHRGDIKVQSSQGEGTTFNITLPIEREK